jgi:hypothetical protein
VQPKLLFHFKIPILFSFFSFFSFLLLWQYWGLNSVPCTWQASIFSFYVDSVVVLELSHRVIASYIGIIRSRGDLYLSINSMLANKRKAYIALGRIANVYYVSCTGYILGTDIAFICRIIILQSCY